jgi:hypothetical protein
VTGLFALVILVGVATLPLWLGKRLWAMRSRELERRWADAPSAVLDEPIRAVKWARIRVDPEGGAATLAGLTVGDRYEAEGVARCRRGCDAPAEGCDCGFYAIRPGSADQVFDSSDSLRHRTTSVRLEVELSGAVLEFEHGFRAAEQRVLRVLVPRRCALCARFDDEREAVALLPTVAFASQRDVPLDTALHLGDRDAWPALEPACDLHHPGPEELAPIGLVELAGLLGTDVGWESRPASGEARPRQP